MQKTFTEKVWELQIKFSEFDCLTGYLDFFKTNFIFTFNGKKFAFMLFALMLFGTKSLFTNPGILIDGDWTTTSDWLGIPSRSECSVKAYLVPRMSDDHFFSFQFWIWKQSFKYNFVRPWVQPLYRREENSKLYFTFRNKWENWNIETKRKMIITDIGGNIVIWIGE